MSECLYDLEDKCKEQLDTLSKSASFIMSLGAKDLYHSNFGSSRFRGVATTYSI